MPRTHIYIFPLLLMAAGCQTMQSAQQLAFTPTSPAPTITSEKIDQCGAEKWRYLVGTKLPEINDIGLPEDARYHIEEDLKMVSNPHRLNFVINTKDYQRASYNPCVMVIDVFCG